MSLQLTDINQWGLFSNTDKPLVIAGPCSVESREQLLTTARELQAEGVELLRAGIWKPRTRPGSFEGVGQVGLEWMCEAREITGMKIATEVANVAHIEAALHAGMDLIWIGARTSASPFTMQEIADALRGTDIPVLVKNPVNPDVELWIGALERLNRAGITRLGAIHRGFSVYGEHRYRNEPQWQIPIEVRRRFPDLLMFCDPSHIAGDRNFIPEISQKAMDLGFDGLMVESHCAPQRALSDAAQQITPYALGELIRHLIIRFSNCDNPDYRHTIEELRGEIDRIDLSLLNLLEQRMELSDRIGTCKKQSNIAILQRERWQQLLDTIIERGEAKGLDREMLKRIYQAIHQASIDRQTRKMDNF